MSILYESEKHQKLAEIFGVPEDTSKLLANNILSKEKGKKSRGSLWEVFCFAFF